MQNFFQKLSNMTDISLNFMKTLSRTLKKEQIKIELKKVMLYKEKSIINTIEKDFLSKKSYCLP